MQSSRRPALSSTPTLGKDQSGDSGDSLEYRWAIGTDIAALTLAGDRVWLAAKRLKRRPDRPQRLNLYHIEGDGHPDRVEFLGGFRTFKAAQGHAEHLVSNGPFSLDPICFADQPWHHQTRIPVGVIRLMHAYGIPHSAGMTRAEANDRLAVHLVTRLLRDYAASRR